MKIKHIVRQSLFLPVLLGVLCLPAIQAHAYTLPDIEAHQFKVTPIEKSRTGRVYRFKVGDTQLPKVGNILLIEENGHPTLAFRVLNSDSAKNMFVAKRVRRYDTTSDLTMNSSYQAAEKIADLVSPPPPEVAAQAKANPDAKPVMDPAPTAAVAQVTKPAPPVMGDSALDSTTTSIQANKAASDIPPLPDLPDSSLDMPAATPAPVAKKATSTNDSELDVPMAKNKLTNNSSVDQFDAALDSSAGGDPNGYEKNNELANDDDNIIVKEKVVLSPYKYMLGLSVGSYKDITNGDFSHPPSGGFGLSFSHVISRNWLTKSEFPQDTLNLEYGFEYYSRVNVNGHNDDYTFLPLKVELRYDLHVSELFSPFVYIGAQYNLIMSTTNVDRAHSAIDNASYVNLGGAQPNLGVGLWYVIGPQWNLRLDVGIDRFAIGLAVRW